MRIFSMIIAAVAVVILLILIPLKIPGYPFIGYWASDVSKHEYCDGIVYHLSFEKDTFRYTDERTNACSLFSASPFVADYRHTKNENSTYSFTVIDAYVADDASKSVEKSYNATLLSNNTLTFNGTTFHRQSIFQAFLSKLSR